MAYRPFARPAYDRGGQGPRHRHFASARQADLAAFNPILGMDSRNVAELRGLASPETARKVHLFMAFATGRSDDVPDPYYETADAFEALYQMLEAGCSSLLAKLVRPS